eukprot:CAMPEP_0114312698 /NCGR_PEP_ID=MMETSP0059-20121206/20620_1 /TAXON_ID=36894 /ORGANISM="Pyramimonas parkeae, Strain CCMP726" /LENGTH=40 /DNA_ID= /DNA_START= /DNA_END= /DNA_ORIENTATION=
MSGRLVRRTSAYLAVAAFESQHEKYATGSVNALSKAMLDG